MSNELSDKDVLHGVSLFLAVVRERLDCLKENNCILDCDALTTLEGNLDIALGLIDVALGKTKPFAEIQAELKR